MTKRSTIACLVLLCCLLQSATTQTPVVAKRDRIIKVHCKSTKGDFDIEGFFTNIPLFRVSPGFLVQFGISLDPAMNARFGENIRDDPSPGIPFRKGLMSYAGYGKDSRSTQVFISYEGVQHLGQPSSPWETPFGEVTVGMEAVEAFYGGYKDNVDQGQVYSKGKPYLDEHFPKLDYLQSCELVRPVRPAKKAP